MNGQDAPAIKAGALRAPRWPRLASAYVIMQTLGVFTIVDTSIYGTWSGKSGDKLTQSLNLLQIICSIALFVRGYLKSRSLSPGAILLIILAFFLLSSSLWSIEPAVSSRRGILYLFFVLGAIGIAEELGGDVYMSQLRAICFLSAAASLALYVIAPGIARMESGELQGIFSHKNVLGQVLGIGTIATLHVMRSRRQRFLSGLMLLTFLVAVVLAKSGTSLMSIVVFCVLDTFLTLLRRGGASRIIGLLLLASALPFVVIMLVNPDLIFDLLGKDPTLTGRTILWQYVDFYIAERPLLGWGLTAFWSPDNELANAISGTLGWVVPEAHNGIRELLLEVGVIGTLFFLVLLIRNIVLAFRCLTTPGREIGASALLCYLGIVLVGITEQVLIDPGQAYTPVFFICGLICDNVARAQRRAAFARFEQDTTLDRTFAHTN